MIFLRTPGGISHDPAESVAQDDVEKAIGAACIFSTNSPRRSNSAKGQTVHNLGQTRSSQQPNHLLFTPDTFVRTTLPGMKACSAIVHVGPALGARSLSTPLSSKLAENWARRLAQRFIFVIEGDVRVEAEGKSHELSARGYSYFPREPRIGSRLRKRAVSRSLKNPIRLSFGRPPHSIVSNEDAISSHPLGDDPDLQVKCLLPDQPPDAMSFDFRRQHHGLSARGGTQPWWRCT